MMFARRLVALALTYFILLGTIAVPTVLLTVSSLFSSQPLRDNSLVGAFRECTPVDLDSDRSPLLDPINDLIAAETPTLPHSSTQTSPASLDRTQLTLCSRAARGLLLPGGQVWRALVDAGGAADRVGLAADQLRGIHALSADAGVLVLRL